MKSSRRELLGALAGAPGLPLIGARGGPLEPTAAHIQVAAAPPRPAEPGSTSRIFDIRRYGADGTAGSDATPAFLAMHRDMRRLQQEDDAARAADPNRPPAEIVIILPPGHYQYTWNRWTWGLRRVTVFGYGAMIQCLHSGPFDVDQAPLITNRDHYWVWDMYGPTHGGARAVKEDYGRLIHTARPGDEAVILMPRQDNSVFAPGAWVLVQSYAQQQYGYPPNMRYFERTRIVSIDGPVIRLDRPILHLHKEDWPEGSDPTAVGRARIVAIDRPDCPLAEEQRLLGLTVASNPNHAVRDPSIKVTVEILGIVGALNAEVRDCRLIALGISQVETAHIGGCSIAYTEPDKLIDRLTFESCRIRSLQQCTGVNQLTLRDCTIETNAQLLAREVTVDSCSFPGTALPGEWLRGINLEGPNPTRRMSVLRSRFLGRSDPTGRPMGGQVWADVTIDGTTVRLLDDSRIAIASNTEPFAVLVDLVEEGWPVLLDGRSGPQFGSCSAIAGRGNDAVFTFAMPAPLKVGDILRIPRLESLVVQDCRFHNLRIWRPDVPFLTWEHEAQDSQIIRLEWRSDFALRDISVNGYLRRIRCSVVRPYSGPADGCFLALQEPEQAVGGILLSVNLSIPGHREVSLSAVALREGDRFQLSDSVGTALPELHPVRSVEAFISDEPRGMAAAMSGAEVDQADFTLEIEVDSPFAWTARTYSH